MTSFLASSSKTSVICDNPNSEIERIETRLGIPFMTLSIGMVTNRSTSSAAWPGKRVRICTETLVTSGKASTGSSWKALAPHRRKMTISTSITARLCRTDLVSLSIMRFEEDQSKTGVALRRRFDQRLQKKSSFRDDLLARFDALQHGDFAVFFDAHRHLLAMKKAGRFFDENERVVAFHKEGLGGNLNA